MPRAPILIDVRVRQRTQRATIANLRQYGRNAVRDLRIATARSALQVKVEAFFLAPVDSEFMRDHIRVVPSKGGLAYQIGYDEADFAGEGKPPYYLFQELGFRHWLTGAFIQNPHLRPAFEKEQPRYLREVARMLRLNAARLRSSN